MSAAVPGASGQPLDDAPSRRSVPMLGKIAIATGLVVSALLFLRLVQVHSDDGPGELLVAVGYGVLLVAPFLASLLASRRASPRGLRRTWIVAAAVTVLLAWTSVSVALLPLAAAALALFLASLQIRVTGPPATEGAV
jgi:low temperature requirement protein LtrA